MATFDRTKKFEPAALRPYLKVNMYGKKESYIVKDGKEVISTIPAIFTLEDRSAK